MDDCIFCKIVRKELPAEIVYEDDFMLVFLDINPVNEGHVLVIPKEHHAYMQDTPDDVVARMFTVSKSLMQKIKTSMQAELVVISVVGIDIPHFHIHLIPRFKDDGLKGFWPTRKYKSPERMHEVAETIRKSLV